MWAVGTAVGRTASAVTSAEKFTQQQCRLGNGGLERVSEPCVGEYVCVKAGGLGALV